MVAFGKEYHLWMLAELFSVHQVLNAVNGVLKENV